MNCSLPRQVPVIVVALPPLAFGPVAPPVAHTGPRRVLCFGRLRAYKGLDLLAEALRLMGPRPDMEVRVVGQGPESTALADLRALPGVKVENRWVPEVRGQHHPELVGCCGAAISGGKPKRHRANGSSPPAAASLRPGWEDCSSNSRPTRSRRYASLMRQALPRRFCARWRGPTTLLPPPSMLGKLGAVSPPVC